MMIWMMYANTRLIGFRYLYEEVNLMYQVILTAEEQAKKAAILAKVRMARGGGNTPRRYGVIVAY